VYSTHTIVYSPLGLSRVPSHSDPGLECYGSDCYALGCLCFVFSYLLLYVSFHALLSVGPICVCFFRAHDIEGNKFFRHKNPFSSAQSQESLFLFVPPPLEPWNMSRTAVTSPGSSGWGYSIIVQNDHLRDPLKD